MLEFPTTINLEQLAQSLIIQQLLESIELQNEIENFSEFEKALTEEILWQIINSLTPLEE